MWTIHFKYDDKKNIYKPVQSGFNVVPSVEIDKILPVEEHVSRQAEKVYFQDGKLRLIEGMQLLSKEELNELDKQSMEVETMGIPFPNVEETKITKVES